MRKIARLQIAMLLVLALAFTSGAPAAQEQTADKRPMTVDDALDIVSVSAQAISPDGQWVLYSQRKLDWEDNEYDSEVWMAAADGSDAWKFLGEEGGGSLAFSPDGSYITMTRRTGEGDKATSQIFWMRTGGGEAVQLTEHATSVGRYLWSQDATKIFFSAEDERPKEEQEKLDKGDDAIFVDEGPNGQTRDYWSNLWVFDIKTKEERKLTDEEFLLGGFEISPDGSKVALSARYTNRRNDADKSELFVLDVESGQKERLTDNMAPERVGAWRPDGTAFLFGAADDDEWLNRNSKLWLMDARLGEHRLLSQNFPGEIRGAWWTPDGSAVLINGTEGVNSNVFRIDAETGEVTRITDHDGSVSVGDFSEDRNRFVYGLTDYDSPTDLWIGSTDGSDPVRLTDANPQLEELALASMEVIEWESTDGTEIQGLLHLPANVDQDGPALPLMLNIHGGPAGVFSNSFRASYHLYAGLGWASLSPNVRGSCCYDDTLREGNTVDRGDGIGFGDYQDLMTGVDALVELGIADPDRLALRGWSYGGILGGWTITQTDRFKAASIGAGVYDWTSEYGPGFNNDVRLWHIGGTPWDNPDGYRNQSALTHVANVTTPTLLIHGMNDTTDTEQQSMMFFAALKDIGKAPVRYMRVPREPHGFREPRHQRTRDVVEIAWMHEHVLGEEWTPWERPKPEEDAAEEDGAEEVQDQGDGAAP